MTWFPKTITPLMNKRLLWLPSKDEVKENIFNMKRKTIPRPDEMISEFYQQQWETIKGDIIKLVHEFFKGRHTLKHLNATLS